MRALVVLGLLLAAPMGVENAAAQDWPGGAFNPYERLPIRVHIDQGGLSDATRHYIVDVRDALDWWERGGHARLQWAPAFEEATYDADIVISFEDAASVACGETRGAGCGGFGGPRYANRYGFARLALREPAATPEAEAPYRSPTGLFDVAVHEIGHALGLAHAADPRDVMHEGKHAGVAASAATAASGAVQGIPAPGTAGVVLAVAFVGASLSRRRGR